MTKAQKLIAETPNGLELCHRLFIGGHSLVEFGDTDTYILDDGSQIRIENVSYNPIAEAIPTPDQIRAMIGALRDIAVNSPAHTPADELRNQALNALRMAGLAGDA